MYDKRPHFKLNKQQRNGVFAFLIIIVFIQVCYYYFPEPSATTYLKDEAIQALNVKIDSLKKVKQLKAKSKRFNPNFLTDEQGYLLGMSIDEIDRLFAYRKKNKWVHSSSEFQQVTQISDSLATELSPLFRFPQKRRDSYINHRKEGVKEKRDINRASPKDFEKVKGVGKTLSQRIIKYRNLLGGFSTMDQLGEVWGLSAETIARIKEDYSIKTLPAIERLNVNTASFKEVLSIVYLNYNTTKMLFKYRDSVGEIKDLEEIKKIPEFPIDKYDRIALYLRAK